MLKLRPVETCLEARILGKPSRVVSTMFISVQSLQQQKIGFAEEFRPGAIDLGAEIRQQTALKSSGRAELIEEHHGRKGIIQDIRVVGDFSTKLEVNCARCLDPVLRDLHRTFDLLYRPRGTDAGVKEIAIGEAETDIGYYEGEGLLLEDVLREQVLLAAPMKAVCREECKGLCPHCGRNLNLESCVCLESVVDPRWAALKEIKEKLES